MFSRFLPVLGTILETAATVLVTTVVAAVASDAYRALTCSADTDEG